jgi:hypothetical protein
MPVLRPIIVKTFSKWWIKFGRTKKPLAKISINVDKTALKPGFLFDFKANKWQSRHCRRVMCAWVAGL